MVRRGKAWLAALALAYCISCFLLIFVYETYFRELVVGTLVENDLGTFDVNNGSRKRRTAAAAVVKPWQGGPLGKEGRTVDRIHECQLRNETIRLPAAPNLIVAGAMKGGTTYLWHLLRGHPDFIQSKKFESHFFDWKFAIPPNQIKRPSFWLRFNATTEEDYLCAARKEYIEDTFKYASLMKPDETRLSYEKTPNYMFLPQVPELIHNICPWKPKIILILRNPVDRAYSHFVMDSSKEKANLPFEEYIRLELKTLREQGLSNLPDIPTSEWGSLNESRNQLFEIPNKEMTQEEADQANWMVYRQRHMRNYLQRGIYSVQLERWMKYFPLNESLMVINNERLHREPRKVIGEVLRFVGARKSNFYENEAVSVTYDVDMYEKRELTSTLARSMSSLLSVGGYEPMSNGTRHFLSKFFKPYNAQLQHLLGEEWKDIWFHE